MLKERHEIDTNHNHLHLKFSQMQTDEKDRKEKVRRESDFQIGKACSIYKLRLKRVHLFPLSGKAIKLYFIIKSPNPECLWPISRLFLCMNRYLSSLSWLSPISQVNILKVKDYNCLEMQLKR